MKLIIDIPEDIYNHIVVDSEYFTPSLVNAFKNGIPIPDNATNGDVIEKVFNTTSTQFCELVRMDNIDNGLCCSLDWWNAPYQKGGK